MQFDALPLGQFGFGIAVAVIAIMLSIGGIVLGLGYALDDKRLKEFGKSEIYQSIINGALVGAFLALFAGGGIMTSLINSIASGSNLTYSCPAYMDSNAALCFSYGYLMGLQGYAVAGTQYSSLFVTVSGLLVALLGLSTILGAIAAINVNLLLVSVSFSSILSPIIGELQYVAKIVTALLLGITVQGALLSFIAIAAVTAILPIGLILRSFYPTRKLGGFFIAMAIGTYVVLPLSYVFNATLINSYSDLNSTNLDQISSSATSIGGQLTGATSANQINGIFPSISGALQSVVGQLDQALSGIMLGVSKLIMQVFILPAFSLIITAISVRELSELLGSEAFFGKFDVL
ncbi:MAG: hypothetical protein KGH49_01940 [Candidatus Micrarchaeota archaeon]|nr:hypothetical protein [Candidatus Micrarchaeota archaeon]